MILHISIGFQAHEIVDYIHDIGVFGLQDSEGVTQVRTQSKCKEKTKQKSDATLYGYLRSGHTL